MTEKQIYHLDNNEGIHYYTNNVNVPKNDSTNFPCIIFDNGSYYGRAGWNVYERPNLVFPTLVQKSKRFQNCQEVLVGNEVNFSSEYTKYTLKSPFYNDIVLDYATQENIMDYVFKNLSINSHECVDFPFLMTETYANPIVCRKYMTELMFELYGVPSLCYGVDALFAFNAIHKRDHASNKNILPDYALIISLSHSATHIIPRIDGLIQYSRSKRLNIGGQTIHKYLSNLISLSCPTESYQMFPNRIKEVVQNFVEFTSMDYFETLDNVFKKSVNDIDYGIFLQLPTVNGTQNGIDLSTADTKTMEKSLSADNNGNYDSRPKNLKFYQQMHAHHNANRLIKIQSLKNEIAMLEDLLKEDDEESSKNNVALKLQKLRIQLEEIMLKYKTSEDFLNGIISLEEILISNAKNKLTPEEVAQLQQERLELIEKKKSRQKEKKDLSNRKGSSIRNRIKLLAKLVSGDYSDNESSAMDCSKSSKKQTSEDEDLFGLNDDDWDIYRSNNNHSDHDSDAENDRIMQIENKLAKAKQPIENPNYKPYSTNIEELYRIKLTTEPYRAAEVLFKPYIAGYNKHNGLSECIESLLKQFTFDQQNSMCQNIYVTGGLTNIKNFYPRICAEFQCFRPFETISNISVTYNSIYDAWDGACNWLKSLDHSFVSNTFTEKKTYDEYGSSYPYLFIKHPFSNNYPQL